MDAAFRGWSNGQFRSGMANVREVGNVARAGLGLACHLSESGREDFAQQGVPLIAADARAWLIGVHQVDDDSLDLRDDRQSLPPLPLAVKVPSGMPSSGCARAFVWIHHMNP